MGPRTYIIVVLITANNLQILLSIQPWHFNLLFNKYWGTYITRIWEKAIDLDQADIAEKMSNGR